MVKLLKTILVLGFLIVCTIAFAQSDKQQHYIDSLKTELKASVDTNKVIILVDLSIRTSKFDFEKSYKYAIQALRLSNVLKYKKGKGDALQSIATYYKRTNNDSLAIVYYEKSLVIKQEIGDSLSISRIYNNIGLIYFNKSEFQKAIDYYLLALNIKQKFKFTDTNKSIREDRKSKNNKSIGISFNNIGNVYMQWGKYEQALKYYQKAERIFIKQNFAQGLSSTANNMGLIYENLAQFTDSIKLNKALSLYEKGLEINHKLNNAYGIMEGYNNSGNIYSQLANVYKTNLEEDSVSHKINDKLKQKYLYIIDKYNNKSLKSYKDWLNIATEINSEQGIAQSLLAIGSLYNNMEDWKNAEKYLLESLGKLLIIDDKYNLAVCYNYLGSTFKEKGNYNKASNYLEKSIKIANEIGVRKVNINNYSLISEVYEKEKDYYNALKYFKTYTAEKDSLFSLKSDKILQELQTKYETEKKETEIRLLNKDKELQDNQIELNKTQIKQQQMIIWGFVLVVIIVSVFAFFIFRLFSQKKKANILLNEQKKEITSKNDELNQQNVEISAQRDEIKTQRDNVEKQKHIIEEIYSEVKQSIQYAKRIQSAILPQEKDFSKYENNKFIYFRPRDIVSGDFYWIKESANTENIIYVAADCTGHGVPGAFMSMLGVAFLNEIVNRKEINKASLVLDELRASVIKSLHQTGVEGEQKDGMDLALIALNNKKSTLEFAGANNPMYLVRKGETLTVNKENIEPTLSQNDYNLFEVKGDKMPLGIHLKGNIPFKNNIVKVNKGDRVYIFSDGYPDQFGGPKGKKFMYKPFKKLLLGMQEESMQTQEALLDKTFLDWRGKVEQIDDVIIIGIEI